MSEREKLKKLAEGFTEWELSTFSHWSGREHNNLQDVADTVAYSAMQGVSTELWGVALPKAGNEARSRVVCYTGNGPTSEVHARFMAQAPSTILALLSELEQAEDFSVHLKAFGITDSDILKHTLEDHARWRKEVVALDVENGNLKRALRTLREASEKIVEASQNGDIACPASLDESFDALAAALAAEGGK